VSGPRSKLLGDMYLAAVILAFLYFRVIGSESFSKVVHALR